MRVDERSTRTADPPPPLLSFGLVARVVRDALAILGLSERLLQGHAAVQASNDSRTIITLCRLTPAGGAGVEPVQTIFFITGDGARLSKIELDPPRNVYAKSFPWSPLQSPGVPPVLGDIRETANQCKFCQSVSAGSADRHVVQIPGK